MKVKMIISMMFFIVLSMQVTAQFRISTGVSALYGKGQIPKGADSGTEIPTIVGYGIFFYPRYNITETDAGAISVGFPLTLGFSGSVNTQSGGNISLTADLPMTIDYNVGAAATEDSEAGVGGFIGAGFGYTYTNQTYSYYVNGTMYDAEKIRGKSYGPLAHAGFKANINQKVYFLRAFYKIGIEKERYKIYGASIGVSF